MSLDRRKLARVLAMGGSVHDGEVAAALRRAEAMLKAAGVTWSQLLDGDDRTSDLEHQLTIAVSACEQLIAENDSLKRRLARFEVLCRALDARFPIRDLPIGLLLEFESMAEQLGLLRPWGPARD